MAPQHKKKQELSDDFNKCILLKKFASIENLAHNLAYDDSIRTANTIPLLEYDGKLQNARVIPIPINNHSIVANILEIKSSNPELPNKVEVIWKGTHDKGSAIADLDPTSPGYSEYMKNRSIILFEVNKSIGRMAANGKKVSVGSYGHSLGGSLAQVFAVDIMDAIAQNQQVQQQRHHSASRVKPLAIGSLKIPSSLRTNFSKVNNITIGTFNSAGVSKKTANRCKQIENYLHNCKLANKKHSPTISYFAALTSQDGVQQTGEASILADSTISEVCLLKTDVKKGMFYNILTGAISIGGSLLIPKFGPNAARLAKTLQDLSIKAIGTLNAHTSHLFDKEHNLKSKVINFNLYQNKYLEDRAYITKQLNNKSEILQNPILKAFQAKIYYFADKLLNRNNKTEKEKSTMAAKPTIFSSIRKNCNKTKKSQLHHSHSTIYKRKSKSDNRI